ncbi:MAG TPA: patatin-like phospholipase family protein [Chloroflexia bacterium]|nr:patatin-like phospholipase family protein [Chloroflexia bacterium]
MREGVGNRRRVALVIGSGGVKCAAALGLWKVLQRENIEVSVAVGCSGGSMYASLIALDFDLPTAQEMTLSFWTSDVMKGYATSLRGVQEGSIKFTERSGLVDDSAMMVGLQKALGDLTFADTRVPLHLVATDFYKGERVVLSSGRLLDAVRASLAIPTIFPPWEVDGRLLVDGAASDPLPVDVAIQEGGHVIIAMGFELPYRPHMNSLTAVNSHLNNIYTNNLLKASFAFHNAVHHDEIIPLMPQFERSIGMFDTHLIPEIIAQGERAAEEQIGYLVRLLDSMG